MKSFPCILVVYVICSFAISQCSANQVFNSDMESSTKGKVDGWSFTGWDKSNPCRGEYVAETSHSPKHCLKMSNTVAGKTAKGKWTQEVKVIGRKTYRISCWLKGSGLTGGTGITVRWYGVGSGAHLSIDGLSKSGTYGWTYFSKDVVAPAAAVRAVISFIIYKRKGTIWADDIKLQQIKTVEVAYKKRPAAEVKKDCRKIRQKFLALYALPELKEAHAAALDVEKLRNTSIKAFDNRITKLMKTQIMNPSDKGFGSWGIVKDIKHHSISYDAGFFGKPLTLACAYASSPSRHYHSPKVLKHLEASLNFGKQFIRIGQKRPSNWWAFDIGIPMQLSTTLLLVGDKIDGKLYRELIRDLYDLGYNYRMHGFQRGREGSGANALWVAKCAFQLGVLENDQKLLAFAREIFNRVNASTAGEGIQGDGSYHFHGPGLNMSYGGAHLMETAKYLYLTANTAYCLNDKARNTYLKFFDFAVWNVYRGRISPYTNARGISRPNAIYDNRAMMSALYLWAGGIDEVQKNAMATIADWEKGRGKSPAYLGLQTFCLAASVWDKLCKKPAPVLSGTRFFPCSDYLIARNDKFFCAIRMASTRTKTWFSMGNENIRGHYSGEGTLVLMTDGREYEPDTIITQPWDDLSGITRAADLHLPHDARGQSAFVGGIALGDVGVCGMKYALQRKQKDIRAYKSYFSLKDVIVMLGADIKASGTTSPAETMILTLPVQKNDNSYYLDGAKAVFADGTTSLKNIKSFFYRNTGVLLVGADASLKIETRTKKHSWINKQPPYLNGPEYTRQFFSLRVNHGVNPTAGKYAAIILPAWKLTDVTKAAKNPPVRIIRNDKNIQAVEASDGSCAAMVFYKAGTCKTGSLSWAGYLAWKKDREKISVALFTERAGKITVKLPFTIDKSRLPDSAICEKSGKNGSTITVTLTSRKQTTLKLFTSPV